MLRFNDDAGPAGSVSSYSPAPPFSGSSNDAPAPSRRGRVRNADFGMPARDGLLDLARTYLEVQARLWPDLAGTTAVPAADAATIAAMADDFERRFRHQQAEVFRPAGTPIAWIALAVAYLRFSDENSNPRSLDQQLLNVLNRSRRDGVFVPWQYVLADAAGNLVITHKNTIEKVVEIDPEAAEWTRRGAEMIAFEGKSAVDVARLFNEHKVGGKQTWSDSRVRQHYGREKLIGKDVFRKTKQVTDRQTGKKKVIHLPTSEWIWRDVPHLRILSNELAEAVKRKLGLGAESFGRKATERRKKAHRVDLYPKVLIRPVCGCCGNPMILGRSVGKYQSFFCFNANKGIHGCTNRGYKSARIIDEAVLGTVMATLFTDGFLADLTADVNKRLAWIARQPIPSTKKLEQEIANEDRQLRRLTDRLAKLDDTHLDAVLAKAEEMGRQLAAKREQLKELQRAGRRPSVKSVKEKDVVAALTHLRDLLQGDVGVAAQVLKALVGDVILEVRQVEGQAKPQMVARFSINAVPALAVLERGRPTDRDVAPAPVWGSIHPSPTDEPATAGGPPEAVVPLTYDRREAARRLRKSQPRS
jgi:hypothetical protein